MGHLQDCQEEASMYGYHDGDIDSRLSRMKHGVEDVIVYRWRLEAKIQDHLPSPP